jgi:tetratricopeptide (TPR) repeat protein
MENSKSDIKKIIQDHFDQSINFTKINDYQSAIECFCKTIELDPNNLDAHIKRARYYEECFEYNNAIIDYTQAIKLSKKLSVEIYRSRAFCYRMLNKNNEALKDYNKVIKLVPNSTILYLDRANLYLKQGKENKALKDYQKLIKLNPKNMFAFVSLGFYYEKKKVFDKALENYNKVINLNTRNYYGYLNRSDFYRRTGDYLNAYKDADKAIEFNPHSFQGYFSKGIIDLLKHRYNKAQNNFTEALNKCSKSVIYHISSRKEIEFFLECATGLQAYYNDDSDNVVKHFSLAKQILLQFPLVLRAYLYPYLFSPRLTAI